jgi:hypothetical protein
MAPPALVEDLRRANLRASHEGRVVSRFAQLELGEGEATT